MGASCGLVADGFLVRENFCGALVFFGEVPALGVSCGLVTAGFLVREYFRGVLVSLGKCTGVGCFLEDCFYCNRSFSVMFPDSCGGFMEKAA